METMKAVRLDVLERLAGYAELAGDLADAVPTWREVADRHGGVTMTCYGSAIAHRRLAAVLELQGRWQEALASREQAAVAFTAAGSAGRRGRGTYRLGSPSSIGQAASAQPSPCSRSPASRRVRRTGSTFEARIMGHEGNARARMGEGPAAVDLTRSGLALALEHGLTGAAAEIYQRLADALEHTGDYAAAKETYDEAFSFCSANALSPPPSSAWPA